MPVIGVRPTMEQLTRKKLTIDDVMALRTLAPCGGRRWRAPACKATFRVGDVSVKYNGKKVAGHHSEGSTAAGCGRDRSHLRCRAGMFTDAGRSARRPRCAFSATTRQKSSFGNENPIGKEVNVESGLYTVIGVLDKQKQPFGGGKNPNDNMVFFPMGTFHNLHPEDLDMWVSVKYDDPRTRPWSKKRFASCCASAAM